MKELLGKTIAKDLIKSNMKIGIGTGSTVYYLIKELACMIRNKELLNIEIYYSSLDTKLVLCEFDLNINDLNNLNDELDLTIDGADQILSNYKAVIKGGGGALTQEKILAYNSKEFALILTEDKIKDNFDFKLPIEIIKEAYTFVSNNLKKMAFNPELRQAKAKAGPLITDNNNYILDCTYKKINDLIEIKKLEKDLNNIPGVIENGFFTREFNNIYIARKDKIEKLNQIS